MAEASAGTHIRYLLPYGWRWPGVILLLAGLAGAVAYLATDLVITLPMPAIYSSFLETHIFRILPTNITDETILILLLSGCFLLCFSREKEEREEWRSVRLKALVFTLRINTAIMVSSILFIYGTGFVAVLAVNLFSPFLLYLVLFRLLKMRALKKMPLS